MNEIELLAPAGAFETALSAFAAGADAVYLGLDAFSARAEAVNFTLDELRLLRAHAQTFTPPKRIYVTFNTLLDNAQLPQALEKLAVLEDIGVDGVIVQDLGVARLVRRHFPALPLHASTQLVAHNLEGVLALKELGFSRVVLARELSLNDIRSITRRAGVEIEIFIHGALCYSISGLCLFSAMEKNRSGNRGKCAYCCRLGYTDEQGRRSFPFSMKDLRADGQLEALREAGVASLKIEGRMKSALYVATVTTYYRNLLDRNVGDRRATPLVTRADLETVFSRRTTPLYLEGYSQAQVPQSPDNPIDPVSLGHLGTPIGTVKRLTKDREGRTWLRFHTTRALEKHDGLQFAAGTGGKPIGFGITQMRTAISRRHAFEVRAGDDIEVLLPPDTPICAGMTVYCSASNAVKRRFPIPSFRPAAVAAGRPVNLMVDLAPTGIKVTVETEESADDENISPISVASSVPLTAAQHPERTFAAVEKAFSRMGTSAWRLGRLKLNDPARVFAPASALNDLRRQMIEQLDLAQARRRQSKINAALRELSPKASSAPAMAAKPCRRLKLRVDQTPLPGKWDELIIAIAHSGELPEYDGEVRLALPLFTLEQDFARLRSRVKNLMRSGYRKWEAADLATLRLLKQCGAEDITADWSLYAFNSAAIRELADFQISRFVCSPENTPENLSDLAEWSKGNGGITPEFIVRQSTPLFISLTRPAIEDPSLLTGVNGNEFTTRPLDGLWITSRRHPRRYDVPALGDTRIDISWD